MFIFRTAFLAVVALRIGIAVAMPIHLEGAVAPFLPHSQLSGSIAIAPLPLTIIDIEGRAFDVHAASMHYIKGPVDKEQALHSQSETAKYSKEIADAWKRVSIHPLNSEETQEKATREHARWMGQNKTHRDMHDAHEKGESGMSHAEVHKHAADTMTAGIVSMEEANKHHQY